MIAVPRAATSTLAKGDLQYLLMARTPRRIQMQEAAGHAVFLPIRHVLPLRGTQTAQDYQTATVQRAMAFLGFEIDDQPNDLFVAVKLPPGWSKKAADHSMWSDLLDEQGRKRAAIFNGHGAFIQWHCRYHVHRDYPRDKEYANGTYRVTAQDYDGTLLFDAGVIGSRGRDPFREERCEEWLTERYPDWRNPFAYW